MENRHTQKSIGAGIVLLIAGIALLLSNLGYFNYELNRYILRWEMFPIALGCIFLFSHDKKGPGIILLVVGGGFYLKNLNLIDVQINFWQLFFSSLLILIGIIIIFRHRIDPPGCQKKNIDNDDFIEEVAIFGGGDRIIISQNFLGGKILAIFGGSNFNLTKAKLAPGKNYIEVLAIFGGMKLIVPENWNVRINAVSIFGGFSDKHRIIPVSPSETSDSELIIKGLVIFGGGEIKSY
jgi:predicted membrane protein